ncbi:hypothetical protein D3C78_1545400 [compost metagenome]
MASAAVVATRAVPTTERLPRPMPLARTVEATSTLMKLVLPGTPRGVPAVITTSSPSATMPSALADWSALPISSSSFWASGRVRGKTPHTNASWRATSSVMDKAKIGHRGR